MDTTRDFHRQLMAHPVFGAGTHKLDFVQRYLGTDGALRDGEVA